MFSLIKMYFSLKHQKELVINMCPTRASTFLILEGKLLSSYYEDKTA